MHETFIIEAYEMKEDYLPIVRKTASVQEIAVRLAKKLAKEYPLVYVSFYRSCDGQIGFINRSGASFEQENWVK